MQQPEISFQEFFILYFKLYAIQSTPVVYRHTILASYNDKYLK